MYAWCHILYIIDEEVSFMEPMGIVQARTSERIKENAANILDKPFMINIAVTISIPGIKAEKALLTISGTLSGI